MSMAVFLFIKEHEEVLERKISLTLRKLVMATDSDISTFDPSIDK